MMRLLFPCLTIAAVLAASAADPSLSKPPVHERAKALALNAPRPVYPASLRKRHVGGAGVFVLHVDLATGVVSSVSVQMSTGVSLLDRTCIDTFQKWRFRPHAVSKVTIPIAFTDIGATY